MTIVYNLLVVSVILFVILYLSILAIGKKHTFPIKLTTSKAGIVVDTHKPKGKFSESDASEEELEHRRRLLLQQLAAHQ